MRKVYTKEELQEILNKHKKWLLNEQGGERANLSGANLSQANLSQANLSQANLSRANLSGADLSGANLSQADLSQADLSWAYLSQAYLSQANLSWAYLSQADLSWANLSGAYLSWAYLSQANLSQANLSGADLSGANLSQANLSGADLSGAISPLSCPDTGAFIGWKKAQGGVIVKLQITDDAKRSSSTGRKCRCSKAVVLGIENLDGTPYPDIQVSSQRDSGFIYRVGETVEVPGFDENRWNECSTGIHFFITRQEAVDY